MEHRQSLVAFPIENCSDVPVTHVIQQQNGDVIEQQLKKSEQKRKIMKQFLQSDLLIPQKGNPEKVTYGSF